ncbi:MAG: hypothetical protein M1828_003142 [Chrysothrix sp. TS-e1954]|nr:MAG: hypothetical protein M1828_003142 [Chrysothrix sp. TS-e1954]
MTSADLSMPEVREKLKGHFSDAATDQYNDRWDALWKDDFMPWDKGQPSPALVDALRNKVHLIGSPLTMGGARRKALVPGCGKGYDVMLLAAHGFDAYGLEISKTAKEAAESFAKEHLEEYARQGHSQGPGVCKYIQGDFFKDDWREQVGLRERGFDLIYDYTFLCALSPEMRPAWAKRHTDLLQPAAAARLVCLEYPTYKEPHTGGPPNGVSPDVYLAHLSKPGEQVPYDDDGYPEKCCSTMGGEGKPSPGYLKRLDHWKPERTHAIGQGTDWMSIWTN